MQIFSRKLSLESLGLIFLLSNFSLGWAEVSAMPQPMAQESASTCQTLWGDNSEEKLNRSRVYTQEDKPKQASQALQQALRFSDRWTNRTRISLLWALLEENQEMLNEMALAENVPPDFTYLQRVHSFLRRTDLNKSTNLLFNFVDLTVRKEQRDLALPVLYLILTITEELPLTESDLKTRMLTLLAASYRHLGDETQAQTILAKATTATGFLESQELSAELLAEIAKEYLRLGKSEQAQQILDKSLDFAKQMNHPDPFHHAWILEQIGTISARLGNYEQALIVADLIGQRQQNLSTYQDQVLALVVGGYGETKQLAQALALVETIQDSSIHSVVLAEIAGKLAKSEQREQAQTYLHKAIATAKLPMSYDSVDDRLSQVALTYAAVSGQITPVLAVVAQMENPDSTAKTLSELAILASNVKETTLSREIIEQALQAVQESENPSSRYALMVQLLDSYLHGENLAIAIPVIQAFMQVLPEDDFGYFDKAMRIEVIVTTITQANEFDLALEIIEVLPNSWYSRGGTYNRALQELATAYARAGKFDQSIALVPRITNDGSVPSFYEAEVSFPYPVLTLLAIATEAQKQGNLALGEQLFEQAVTLSFQIPDQGAKAHALTSLAIQAPQFGQKERAAQFHTEALNIAIAEAQNPEDPRLTIMAQMINLYFQAQDYDSARQTAIASDLNPDLLLTNLTLRLIEVNELAIALDTANLMTNPQEKAVFLLRIANNYLADGAFTEATSILAQALTVTNTIPGEEVEKIVIRDHDPVYIDNPSARANLLKAIALNYGEMGEITKAIEVAQTLKTDELRLLLLEQLTCYHRKTYRYVKDYNKL